MAKNKQVPISLTPEQLAWLMEQEGRTLADKIRNILESAGMPDNLNKWGGDRSTPQSAQNGQGE